MTPIGTYEKLVEWYEKGDLDFSKVTSVNLDEYKGLDRANDQSYYYFMHEHLFNDVNIKEENTNVPNGMEPDADKECARYEELIRLWWCRSSASWTGAHAHIRIQRTGTDDIDKSIPA